MSVIWIYYKRPVVVEALKRGKPKPDDPFAQDPNLKAVLIERTDKSGDVRRKILAIFELKQPAAAVFESSAQLNVKLRRENGNLLPINEYLEVNTKNSPYSLETYSPKKRAKSDRVNETEREIDDRLTTALVTKSLLQKYTIRVEQVQTLLNLSATKFFNDIIKEKLKEIDEKINFIDNRLSDVKDTKWHGVLKRPVLW